MVIMQSSRVLPSIGLSDWSVVFGGAPRDWSLGGRVRMEYYECWKA